MSIDAGEGGGGAIRRGTAHGPDRIDAFIGALVGWTRAVPRLPIDWRWIPVVVLGALAHWAWLHPAGPAGLWSGDAREYAVLARRIADGEGFTTGVIYPAELEFGTGSDHASVLRAPLWPLVIAGLFRVTGPEPWVIHAAVLFFYLATVAATTALAMGMAGTVPGLVAGVAVAACTPLALLTLDGISECLFAFLTTLVFLLCARGAGAFWLGVTCGLAYLTRYNGSVLLAPIFFVLAGRDRPLRELFVCGAGLVSVCAPWWVRNALVAGNPFFSLYSVAMYFDPGTRSINNSILYAIDAGPDHPSAMRPLEKLRILIPEALARFSLASANLAALAGVLVACVRRDRRALPQTRTPRPRARRRDSAELPRGPGPERQPRRLSRGAAGGVDLRRAPARLEDRRHRDLPALEPSRLLADRRGASGAIRPDPPLQAGLEGGVRAPLRTAPRLRARPLRVQGPARRGGDRRAQRTAGPVGARHPGRCGGLRSGRLGGSNPRARRSPA